jgi:hypothetical protein
MTVFFVGVGRTFRVVGRILHALDRCRFQSLIGIGEFFHRFFVGIGNFRETLRPSTLSSALLSNLSRIFSQFVQLSLKIAFPLGRSFVSSSPLVFVCIKIHLDRYSSRVAKALIRCSLYFCREMALPFGGVANNSFGVVLLQG